MQMALKTTSIRASFLIPRQITAGLSVLLLFFYEQFMHTRGSGPEPLKTHQILKLVEPQMKRFLERDMSFYNNTRIYVEDLLNLIDREQYQGKLGLFKVEKGRVEHIAGASGELIFSDFVHHILPAAARRISHLDLQPLYVLVNGWDEPLGQTHFGKPGCLTNLLSQHANLEHRYPLSDEEMLRTPVWSPAKLQCQRDLLYPYWQLSTFPKITNVTPWEEKIPKIFWRGSSSGAGTLRKLHTTNHRIRLVRSFLNLTDSDIRLSTIFHYHTIPEWKNLSRELLTANLTGNYVAIDQWSTYKFLLDIGGSSYSQRLSELCQMRSVVFVISPYDDLLLRSLHTGRHYFRVGLSGAKLLALLEDLRADDDIAKQISNRLLNQYKKYMGSKDYVVNYISAALILLNSSVHFA